MENGKPLTVRQAAEELSLSVHTVRAWLASRRIGFMRMGRSIRIPTVEVRRILEEGFVPARKSRNGRL